MQPDAACLPQGANGSTNLLGGVVVRGKEPFDSAIIAHGVAGRRNEKTRKVYRCLRCGFWHLGRPLADIRMREWPDGG